MPKKDTVKTPTTSTHHSSVGYSVEIFFTYVSSFKKLTLKRKLLWAFLIAISNRYWTGPVTYSNLIESTASPGQTVGRVTLAKFCLHALPVCKGHAKQADTVADTLLPTQMFPRLPERTTFVAGHKKCFWFCSETFCVRNKCFPVCAAQETSWATMCPPLPGP